MAEITDIGVRDIFIGTQLFKTLGLSLTDIQAHPEKMQKMQQIASYLNNHPDPLWVIDRVRNNRTSMSPLDFLATYAQLGEQHQRQAAALKDTEKEMKMYEQI